MENTETHGSYIGIFLLSLVASSLLPVFLEPVVAGLPALGFPLLPTVLVVSTSATLGSLTTYFLGLGMDALTPFPFEVVTFMAGFSIFPVRLYTLGCFMGKLSKFVILMIFGGVVLDYFF